jgi:hypothetical protein
MVSGRENSTLLLAAQLDCQAKESPDYEYPIDPIAWLGRGPVTISKPIET